MTQETKETLSLFIVIILTIASLIFAGWFFTVRIIQLKYNFCHDEYVHTHEHIIDESENLKVARKESEIELERRGWEECKEIIK